MKNEMKLPVALQESNLQKVIEENDSKKGTLIDLFRMKFLKKFIAVGIVTAGIGTIPQDAISCGMLLLDPSLPKIVSIPSLIEGHNSGQLLEINMENRINRMLLLSPNSNREPIHVDTSVIEAYDGNLTAISDFVDTIPLDMNLKLDIKAVEHRKIVDPSGEGVAVEAVIGGKVSGLTSEEMLYAYGVINGEEVKVVTGGQSIQFRGQNMVEISPNPSKYDRKYDSMVLNDKFYINDAFLGEKIRVSGMVEVSEYGEIYTRIVLDPKDFVHQKSDDLFGGFTVIDLATDLEVTGGLSKYVADKASVREMLVKLGAITEDQYEGLVSIRPDSVTSDSVERSLFNRKK